MRTWLMAAGLAALASSQSVFPTPPAYSAESIANAAAGIAGSYAPNTFISIYGTTLAYSTAAIGPGDIRAGQLPNVLGTTGVRVLINQLLGDMYYVSPNQINVLIPTSLIAGPAVIQVVNSGLAGPPVSIMLGAAAPALFQSDAKTVIATHGNGPLITPASPAVHGEIVVLYATGLGPTSPPAIPHQLAASAAQISDLANFRVLLNDVPVDSHAILYAGVTPGFAGLYQINLKIPPDAPASPEIRIGFASAMSPAGRILPVQ